jgi:hypothetical protein
MAGGSNPAAQSVTISNTGGGALNWTASKTQSWLTLSATSGAAPATLAVGAVTAGLAGGTYTDTVTVAASGASGSPQIVNVTLNVSAAPPPPTPALSLSGTAVSFSAAAGRIQSYAEEYYDHKLGRRNSQLDREQDPAVANPLGLCGNCAVEPRTNRID